MSTLSIYSVYIPRLLPSTTENDLVHNFHFYDLADILRIDWNHKYDQSGTMFKQAFLHLIWRNNETADNLRNRIEDAETCDAPAARLVYNDPYYWILLKAKKPVAPSIAEDSINMRENPQLLFDKMAFMVEQFASDDQERLFMEEIFQTFGLAYNNMKQELYELYQSSQKRAQLLESAIAQHRIDYDVMVNYYLYEKQTAEQNAALAESNLQRFHEEEKKCERLVLALEGSRAKVRELKYVMSSRIADATKANVWEIVDVPSIDES